MQVSLSLTLSCEDRPGIVAAVTTYLAGNGANITEAQQFEDRETGQFFMRVVFDAEKPEYLRSGFADVARRFGMEWRLSLRRQRKRVLIFVSKFGHWRGGLLYPHRICELQIDVVGLIT